MKGLILAAGTGSRLKPLTDNCPKCFVEINGKPMIEYQLEAMEKSGVDEIYIVTGYCAQQFEKYSSRVKKFFHNGDYLNNNMVSSLLFAEEIFSSDLIVSYSDIVYSDKILKELMSQAGDFNITIDLNWLDLWKNREENPLDDAESLTLKEENIITNIGQKTNSIEEIQGQYIGLMKFSKEGLGKIKALVEQGKKEIENGQPAWGKIKNLDKAYLTDLLMALINQGDILKAHKINGQWFEVDTYEDYQLYEREIEKSGFHFNIGRS